MAGKENKVANHQEMVMINGLKKMTQVKKACMAVASSSTSESDLASLSSITTESTEDDEQQRRRDIQLINQLLDGSSTVNLDVLRKILHLLDVSEKDYSDEIEMQKLREEMVQLIKINRDLSRKIDDADTRIGSLIRNFQLACAKPLLERLRQDALDSNHSLYQRIKRRGINDFSKSGRRRLEAYQHLFYALQTDPKYLSRIFIHEPKGRLSKLQHICLFTLFNCFATSREQYLLINLLKTCLDEEITTRITQPIEIIKGQSVSVTLAMAIDVYRPLVLNTLFTSIEPLIQDVIKASASINLTTDPLLIYKAWITETEVQTGTISKCLAPQNHSSKSLRVHRSQEPIGEVD